MIVARASPTYFHIKQLRSGFRQAERVVLARNNSARSIHEANSTENENNDTIRGSLAPNGLGVAVGQTATAKASFTKENVTDFAHVVKDFNPLHQEDPELPVSATSSLEGKILVQGLLVGSIFSRIISTRIPGSVYVHQNLQFRHPVYVNEKVIGKVTVTNVRKRRGVMMTCETTVQKTSADFSEQVACIRGEAQVWIPDGTIAENGSINSRE